MSPTKGRRKLASRPRTVSLQAAANASGVAVINTQPPSGYNWTINHIGISSNSTSNCTLQVTQNGTPICGSSTGTGDAADGGPMHVHDTDTVTLTWSGCSNGAICKASLIVDEEGK